ncbi:hypothetical protein Efla_003823 [Eimeria flavescens]
MPSFQQPSSSSNGGGGSDSSPMMFGTKRRTAEGRNNRCLSSSSSSSSRSSSSSKCYCTRKHTSNSRGRSFQEGLNFADWRRASSCRPREALLRVYLQLQRQRLSLLLHGLLQQAASAAAAAAASGVFLSFLGLSCLCLCRRGTGAPLRSSACCLSVRPLPPLLQQLSSLAAAQLQQQGPGGPLERAGPVRRRSRRGSCALKGPLYLLTVPRASYKQEGPPGHASACGGGPHCNGPPRSRKVPPPTTSKAAADCQREEGLPS